MGRNVAMQTKKALRARQTRNLVSTNPGVRRTFCSAPEPWTPEAEGPDDEQNTGGYSHASFG
jgi:hypothetical protein